LPILFVVPDLFGYGGVQLFSQLALRALTEEFGASRGIQILSRMDLSDTMTNNGIDQPFVACGGSLLRFATEYTRLVNITSWDAIVFMHINPIRLNFLKLRRQRSAVIIHGIEVWRRLSKVFQSALSRVDRIISNSGHTIRHACEINPWMARIPTSVCHLGVPESPLDAELNLPRIGPEYVLSIGRMVEKERYKGFDELIAIWPRIELARPGIRLKLMGDGPDRPRLEAAARAVGANIDFLGRVSDMDRDIHLRNCSAFAMPSRGEGFGLVYLEAMRLGRPVLAGNTDAGGEVFEDRISGRAVNPVDSDELCEGLLDVLGPNGESYGILGRKRFYEHFTYEHFKTRFLAPIRDLVSCR